MVAKAMLPHVCFVAPHAWTVFSGDHAIEQIGGAEMQQAHLARGLAESGFRVSMLCLDYGQAPKCTIDGVELYKLHKPRAGLPVWRFLHPRLSGFWRGMRAVQADIYYQRGAEMLTGVVATFCRWHGRKSIFAAAHNTDFHPGKELVGNPRDRWLYQYGLNRVDAIVVQNEAQLADCRRHFKRDACLVNSAYPGPPAMNSHTRDEILWVSTLRAFKRPELFIELARCLPQFRFTMIGGKADHDFANTTYFHRIAALAGEVPNLRFLGFQTPHAVEAYFDRARIFVNTSTHEGFPNTFLQAWARGVPTVSFFDTGSRDQGGPVVCVVPDLSAMANQLRILMINDSAWLAKGAQCRAYFTENHSLQRTIQDYAHLLTSLHTSAP